jgi:pentose-5-phosphate-3-epimerase
MFGHPDIIITPVALMFLWTDRTKFLQEDEPPTFKVNGTITEKVIKEVKDVGINFLVKGSAGDIFSASDVGRSEPH